MMTTQTIYIVTAIATMLAALSLWQMIAIPFRLRFAAVLVLVLAAMLYLTFGICESTNFTACKIADADKFFLMTAGVMVIDVLLILFRLFDPKAVTYLAIQNKRIVEENLQLRTRLEKCREFEDE